MRTRRFFFKKERYFIMSKDKNISKLSQVTEDKDKKVSKLAQVTDEDDDFKEEFDDLELLERLESLREDMEDLGIRTLDELVKKIDDLHKELDAK